MIAQLLLAGLFVSVDAGDAATTLTELSRQLHMQILFDYVLIHNHPTPAINGEFTPQQAYAALLKDSGLEYSYVNDRTLTVVNPFVDFSINEDPAWWSLLQWSRQSNTNIYWLPETVLSHQTQSVFGSARPLDALKRMLSGSGLTYEVDEHGGVTIQPARKPRRVTRSVSIEQGSHECVCAQTAEGISIGHWCYEDGQVAYSLSCGERL